MLLVGTSLAVQWLRICLPRQGTPVRALVWEDPTYRGATKPVHHNYRAHALEPVSHNYWSPRATTTEPTCPRAHTLQRVATAMRSPHTAMKSSPRSPQLEKARAQQRRPNTAKNKFKNILTTTTTNSTLFISPLYSLKTILNVDNHFYSR